MPEVNESFTCAYCQKILRGRSDKKYCNDYCRSTYNNSIRGPVNNLIRNVNHSLGRNRRILGELMERDIEMAKTTREKLIQKGFEFKYFTHTYRNKQGNVYYFCYDLGYLPLSNDWYLLVKRNGET